MDEKNKKPFYKGMSIPEERALPDYKAESQLPEHSEASPPQDAEVVDSFDEIPVLVSDPTDLALEKDTYKKELQNSDAFEPPKENKKTRKQTKIPFYILLSLLVITIIGAGIFLYLTKFRTKSETVNLTPVDTSTAEKPVKSLVPELKPAPLSGIEVTPDILDRPVTGIMIENSVESRPQSGLESADLVFEAIAEAGITRFLALFHTGMPSSIGPVRSARPYYVEWAKSFDASYLHAGGSDDGLSRISELSVKDLNAFTYEGTYLTRNPARSAPHDLYTTSKDVEAMNKKNNFGVSVFKAFEHKQWTPQTPTASSIQLAISSQAYNPSYTYDTTTNSYKRFLGGQPHIDANSNNQLSPQVVIALVANRTTQGIYTQYDTTGTGELVVFQDGIVSPGTWKRTAATDTFSFTDKNGLSLKLNNGRTWITMVDSTTDITYTP